ncbi:MAG: hypothetical protein RL748_2283 [Pseudomonadota bacterium]|jgi:3-oxoacyl-[acyl-carrier-protein] synthase-1
MSNSPAQFLPLFIVGSAICSSIGHFNAAAVAAMDANISNFTESEFIDTEGEPIVGAALHDVSVWGDDRHKAMFITVFQEIREALATDLPNSKIAVLILGPEHTRPGGCHGWVEGILFHVGGDRDPFHAGTAYLPFGKAGIGNAINRAQSLLYDQAAAPDIVLIIAVDSYFSAPTITHYLSQQRIKTSANPDGFIPGEAAAAIALARQSSAPWVLSMHGCGMAHETAAIGSNKPLRATGLTNAIRSAIGQAGVELAALDCHVSGVSGENWYFKEVELAINRVLERKVAEFPHHIITSRTGEIGAACAPFALAWLFSSMAQPACGIGQSALLHFSNDDGARVALVIKGQYQTRS